MKELLKNPEIENPKFSIGDSVVDPETEEVGEVTGIFNDPHYPEGSVIEVTFDSDGKKGEYRPSQLEKQEK